MWIKLAAGTVMFVVPVTVTAMDTFGYVAKVEGSSMKPALNPEKRDGADYVYLNRWATRANSIQRGDIVSLLSPSSPDKIFIKRIVGLEGDTVKLTSSITMASLLPSFFWQYMYSSNLPYWPAQSHRTLGYKERKVTIPTGHCWVEGDYHKSSIDSNSFGPVSMSLVTARASHIVWPPRRWQRLVAQQLDPDRVISMQSSDDFFFVPL